ncbi:MAG TPA: hypothetical protein VL426_03780 [Candidatus Binatia bacterium]|nr:hypothetical protein [Candidatus Binatia bacterium]
MLWPLVFSIPLFLLPVGYFFWLYVLYSRPPALGRAVTAEYDPPADIAPIEAAVLLDGMLKPRALAAAIVGLHMRGEIDIAEAGGSVEAFRRGAAGGPLSPAESLIMAALFAEGPLTDAKSASERMPMVAKTVERRVIEGLRAKGFIAERSLSAPILFVSAVMAALMVSLSLLPFYGFRAAVSVFCALTLLAQFAYIAATWRPRLSARGKEAAFRLMGYKLWLGQVEGDYIQWQEKENDRVTASTPYAIVFGISLTWATKLQKLTGALLENII